MREVPPPAEREDNVDGAAHCLYCCEHEGWVVDGSAPGLGGAPMDQMAPCPNCRQGEIVEFTVSYPEKPHESKGGRKGDRRPPWGPQGYWRGRDWSYLPKTCDCVGKLRREEAAEAWAKRPIEEYEREARREMAKIKDKVSPEAFEYVSKTLDGYLKGRRNPPPDLTRSWEA